MTLKPRTLGLIGAGVALMAGLAYVSFREDPIPVDLHIIARGPLEVTINADGVTQIKDIYDVASPITGTALRSPVAVGDVVVAGETRVATVRPAVPSLLDSRTLQQAQASVQEAEAALHVAQADFVRAQDAQVLAKSQFDRTKTLVERDVASLTRLEDAAQNLAVAESSVEAATARIEMAQGTLERARTMLREPSAQDLADDDCCIDIFAPADGVVLSISAISERPIVTGAPLLQIGDQANLEIVADLLSSDAVRLQPNASASVERWGGDTSLSAILSRIAPAAQTKVSALGIEEQRLDATFDITSPLIDRAGLGDGFAVYLRITEWRTDDVMQVPLSAIFKDGEAWAVFVAMDDIVDVQTISIGQQNSEFAEVIDGLTLGTSVVAHPNDSLLPGSQIVERARLN